MDQLLEPGLLALGIDDCLPAGVRHTQCFQGSTSADEAWFARDVGLVHRGGKPIRLGEAMERFAPGTLVRGCEQDAVNVENARGELRWKVRSRSGWFADGHDGYTLRRVSGFR
jgi:hypothetical protein